MKLNLLPPSEKKKLKLLKLAGLLVSIGSWFVFMTVIFTLLLLSVYFYLSIISDAQKDLMQQRRQNERTQALFDLEERISQTNKSIEQIHQKQKQMIIWTPVFEHLAEITPEGVHLNSFSYNQSGNRISLSGHADTRPKLLRFEEKLKESEYFKEVESPLSNIINKNDIDFNFEITPTKENIKE